MYVCNALPEDDDDGARLASALSCLDSPLNLKLHQITHPCQPLALPTLRPQSLSESAPHYKKLIKNWTSTILRKKAASYNIAQKIYVLLTNIAERSP